MTDGNRMLTIPRHNPVNALTMGGIVRDAGLMQGRFVTLRKKTTHEGEIFRYCENSQGTVWTAPYDDPTVAEYR